ncbi:hypothetical protein MASR1M60_07300 [Rhodocyclaceae bacterium]
MNTFRASLEFSFKGEVHALAVTIDLDQHLSESSVPPNFHHLLARAGGIDTDSYLYEVLESYEIHFDCPSGLAEVFCRDGLFDWDGFVQQVSEQRDWQIVRTLVAKILALNEAEARPELRAALLAAYRAGKGTQAVAVQTPA